MTSSAASPSAIQRDLSVVAARPSRENSSVGHCDLSLTDPIRFRFLGANTADLHLVANFQRIRSPALPEKCIRRTAFDGIHDALSVLDSLDIDVDVRIHPVDGLYCALEFNGLGRVELRRDGVMRKQRNCRSQQSYAETDHNKRISLH